MDWITKLEECTIELLYAAADCRRLTLAEQLRLLAAIVGAMADEAKARQG